jgi:hypothetical protein
MGELNAGDLVRIIDDAFDDWTGSVGRVVLVLSLYVVCMDGNAVLNPGQLLGFSRQQIERYYDPEDPT